MCFDNAIKMQLYMRHICTIKIGIFPTNMIYFHIMRFKKIYIEITNKCNLNCSFCVPHKRAFKDMSKEEYLRILEQIKTYTKYIYLHVKGEPMLHPHFKDFVKIAYDNGFFVNITTNGTKLKENIDAIQFVRQLNISLHATNSAEIIKTAKQVHNCYVSFRVWNGNNTSLEENQTIELLSKEFNVDILSLIKAKIIDKDSKTLNTELNLAIKDNFYISVQNEWEWPDIASSNDTNGYCHALKDHIAILADGNVVPCCLDNNGDIILGNIFKEDLETILNSKCAIKIADGFKNRICVEKLCQKCTYKLRF